MVPLARQGNVEARRVLICSVHTDCVPLREMLSLLLERRNITHRSFASLDAMLAFLEPLAQRDDDYRLVTMVGPKLTPDQVVRIDDRLHALAGPVALVVFDDAMGEAPSRWDDARVKPCLRTTIPPRFADLLRVVEGRPTLSSAGD